MTMRSARGMWRGLASALVVGSVLAAPGAWAQSPPASPPPSTTAPAAVTDAAGHAWALARASGNDDKALSSLRASADADGPAQLRDQLALLDKNIAKREEARSAKLKEVNEKLQKELDKQTPEGLSEAIKYAVEVYLLTPEKDRDAFKHNPATTDLIKKGAEAAHQSEAKGDWFTANEIFYRLNALMEEEGTFKADARRMSQRLSLIRLYAPEQFWKLRNDERVQSGKSPLPPYNGIGENYKERLEGIDPKMVLKAIIEASRRQIDKVPLGTIMAGGVDALRVMVTTSDLDKIFPTLGEKSRRDAMLTFLDSWDARLKSPTALVTVNTLGEFADDLIATNATSVQLPENALWHEFGNGATGKLDDFSAIIWPDEVARFDRMTQGNFKGVGIQIQLDDESQMIKVVTPLPDTPAQRAGIKTGDLIKKINGQSAIGISLNQAVDLITGPQDSKVSLTIERPLDTGAKPDEHALNPDLEFPLVRTTIDVASVKGWRRNGPAENDWDWFIDKQNQIGYVRLLQFTERTTVDLHRAISQMRDQGGVRGMILDLRYNPGGLLTEAVSVANTFIEHGTIVSTEGPAMSDTKPALPSGAILKGVPLIVLINEGSASASEIVSGAIRHYADKGDINALVLGKRSFGKGSVQNVWPLADNFKMKLTTQYYKLPDGRILHRRPGSTVWGVEPHMKIEMLPEVESDALKLRMDADVVEIDANGKAIESKTAKPDPEKLVTDGLDLQLETALVLMEAKTMPPGGGQARLAVPEPAVRQ